MVLSVCEQTLLVSEIATTIMWVVRLVKKKKNAHCLHKTFGERGETTCGIKSDVLRDLELDGHNADPRTELQKDPVP